jgi:hypothetical protein
MANPEHLEILKRGVEEWNLWRAAHKNLSLDLNEASLDSASLGGAILSGVDMVGANFRNADLREVMLINANLHRANMSYASLERAVLSFSSLWETKLSDANLRHSYLTGVDLSMADLSGANLEGADLNSTNMSGAILVGANFLHTQMFGTILVDVDLSKAKNLELVKHIGPSSIGLDTIYKSRGKIPERFLRGCGVPEDFIIYMHSLVLQPIQFYKSFISYSSKDQKFADRLYADLQNKGVRCWLATEDLKIGAKIRTGIDEAIRLHDKLMLVLSKHSVASDWVEHEVELALERERKEKRTVLFPIRLDDAVMKIDTGWPALVRNTRNIGDFRKWKDHDSYQKKFARLLHDLKAEEMQIS